MSFRSFATSAIGCLSAVALGCDGGNTTREDPANGPMESYRAGAGFDAAKRIFLHGDVPQMPTVIHEEYVEEFISLPGNGGERMVFLPKTRPDWSELVPESEVDRRFEPARTVPLAGKDVLGSAYDPVHESMKLPDGSIRAVREQTWVVRDRQLMSVNAEAGPAVYRIDTPSLHVLMRVQPKFDGKTAPKRPLTEFETAALAKLREGDDVVLQSSSQEMRVLGSIRARNECLSCHKVEVGSLLGAFTYTLTLQSQETPVADRLKDTAGLSQDERSAVQTVESVGGKVKRTPGGSITELYLTYSRTIDMGRVTWFGSPRLRIRDASLSVLSVFPELQVLDVSHSLVTDAGVNAVAKLKQLKKLDLRSTLVTTAGLAQLKKELPGCQILHHSTEPVRP